MTDVAAAPKTFTQADVDNARADGYTDGFWASSDRELELRRAVKAVVDNLRAGIFTELRAIQELEALIGP